MSLFFIFQSLHLFFFHARIKTPLLSIQTVYIQIHEKQYSPLQHALTFSINFVTFSWETEFNET